LKPFSTNQPISEPDQLQHCTGNAAEAHILLAKALLSESRVAGSARVDGEAFNITDDDPHLFWDFARSIWKFAGHEAQIKHVWVLPAPIALALANILEWAFRLFTFGNKRPQAAG
jgi:sterol-4alpha-carboxylate 3-dehydrogenase (decarboxylating)